jgi:predicted HTH domain antitoxin
MSTFSIEVPAGIAQPIRRPDEEPGRVRLDLAVALYAQRLLSPGKAAELAGGGRLVFDALFHERGVPMYYGPNELAQDTVYGRRRE